MKRTSANFQGEEKTIRICKGVKEKKKKGCSKEESFSGVGNQANKWRGSRFPNLHTRGRGVVHGKAIG